MRKNSCMVSVWFFVCLGMCILSVKGANFVNHMSLSKVLSEELRKEIVKGDDVFALDGLLELGAKSTGIAYSNSCCSQSKDKVSALYIAIDKNRPQIVQYLLARGTNPHKYQCPGR